MSDLDVINWTDLSANSFWHDSHRILFNKDCRSMDDLLDETIQCVVTSPPYWGLRKYAGLPDLVWGGDGYCEHKWGDKIKRTGGAGNKIPSGFQQLSQAGQAGALSQTKWSESSSGQFCSLCGAWKGQLGLEPTPEMYIEHLVEIFREVRRVLRKDGVVFLNIGDSYVSGRARWSSTPQTLSGKRDRGEPINCRPDQIGHPYLKDKDLCLIPFRLAIALQEDGWYVRSVIIWNKPNPMPESVTDRPTESHEYILMLTKSAKYYWDAEAVREKLAYGADSSRASAFNNPNVRKDDSGEQTAGITTAQQDAYYAKVRSGEVTGRNLRSVWTFPTQPYPEAHFATYPEKLVEICVKAATPEVGCCSKCGSPWVRIITKQIKEIHKNKPSSDDLSDYGKIYGRADEITSETLGWKQSCKCEDADKIPSIILDPFAGSGTTLKVVAELNRRAIGYELSEDYCKLAVERNKQTVLL